MRHTLCVCVCVCVCVSLSHTCIYITKKKTQTQAQSPPRTHTFTYKHIHTHTYIQTHDHAHKQTHKTCTHKLHMHTQSLCKPLRPFHAPSPKCVHIQDTGVHINAHMNLSHTSTRIGMEAAYTRTNMARPKIQSEVFLFFICL
jgi:hypothetical protein